MIKFDYPELSLTLSLTLFGGFWFITSRSGSRCSDQDYDTSCLGHSLSSRGVSNHFKG